MIFTFFVSWTVGQEGVVVADLIRDRAFHEVATIDGHFVVLVIHLSPLVEVLEMRCLHLPLLHEVLYHVLQGPLEKTTLFSNNA